MIEELIARGDSGVGYRVREPADCKREMACRVVVSDELV